MLTEPIAVTLQVIATLDSLGIPYFIGGSLASALHGVVRSTMDVDLIADFPLEQVDIFVHVLERDFYADGEMIRSAIIHKSSFNLVHLETMFKVDIFITSGSDFERSQFERRSFLRLESESGRSAYVTSAEDILLAKLRWFRMGGEVSDRQWNDVCNILKVQGDRLDRTYLTHWALHLNVLDLLNRLYENPGN